MYKNDLTHCGKLLIHNGKYCEPHHKKYIHDYLEYKKARKIADELMTPDVVTDLEFWAQRAYDYRCLFPYQYSLIMDYGPAMAIVHAHDRVRELAHQNFLNQQLQWNNFFHAFNNGNDSDEEDASDGELEPEPEPVLEPIVGV